MNDATIFPIKYLKYYQTNEETINTVVTQMEFLKELIYRGQFEVDEYIKYYNKFEQKLQFMLKTNKMVAFSLVKNAEKSTLALFVLDYSYDGTPLEIIYGNTEETLLYVQKIDDFMNTTYPAVVENQNENLGA